MLNMSYVNSVSSETAISPPPQIIPQSSWCCLHAKMAAPRAFPSVGLHHTDQLAQSWHLLTLLKQHSVHLHTVLAIYTCRGCHCPSPLMWWWPYKLLQAYIHLHWTGLNSPPKCFSGTPLVRTNVTSAFRDVHTWKNWMVKTRTTTSVPIWQRSPVQKYIVFYLEVITNIRHVCGMYHMYACSK